MIHPLVAPVVRLLLPCMLAGGLVCQSTLVVGPSGFADLDQAYAAAQPGDNIVVQTIATFTQLSGKGVRIFASGGNRLEALSGAVPASIDSIPSGQTLEFIGFDIVPVGSSTVQPIGLRIHGCAGSVVMTQCRFQPTEAFGRFDEPLRIDNCAYVRFDVCLVYGQNASPNGCLPGADGLVVDNSVVDLFATFVNGGQEFSAATCPGLLRGGVGVRASSSTVFSLAAAPSSGAPAGAAPDWQLTNSSVVTAGGCVISGTGVVQSFGGAAPVSLGGASVVHSSLLLPNVGAIMQPTGFAASFGPLGPAGLGLFVLGTPGAAPNLPLPIEGIPLIDVTAPVVLVPTTTGIWNVTIAPAVMALLRGTTWQVTAAEVTAAGSLRFGDGALLRF